MITLLIKTLLIAGTQSRPTTANFDNLHVARYDHGPKPGYLKATLAYGMKHPEIGQSFTDHLELMRT